MDEIGIDMDEEINNFGRLIDQVNNDEVQMNMEVDEV